jgi:hypothetical protein
MHPQYLVLKSQQNDSLVIERFEVNSEGVPSSMGVESKWDGIMKHGKVYTDSKLSNIWVIKRVSPYSIRCLRSGGVNRSGKIEQILPHSTEFDVYLRTISEGVSMVNLVTKGHRFVITIKYDNQGFSMKEDSFDDFFEEHASDKLSGGLSSEKFIPLRSSYTGFGNFQHPKFNSIPIALIDEEYLEWNFTEGFTFSSATEKNQFNNDYISPRDLQERYSKEPFILPGNQTLILESRTNRWIVDNGRNPPNSAFLVDGTVFGITKASPNQNRKDLIQNIPMISDEILMRLEKIESFLSEKFGF